MIKKIIVGVIFSLGLIYIMWPGPTHTTDFSPLPDSLKSVEPGDTYQNPNNAAYYSDFRRKYVTDFYQNQFSYLNIFGIKIPPLRTNHPPEESYTYIRDQQLSTFLEQYNYPLRDSLFVNGFEPFNEQGYPFRLGAHHMLVDGKFYFSKTTIRYYGASAASRLVIYLLIWVSMYFLYKLTKKAVFEK